ncbi:hypothetical protein B4U80_14576, partial [Leptotrombidium deliense]
VQVPIMGDNKESIDAAWHSSNTIYMFRGDKFIAFNYSLTDLKLKLSVTGNGHLGLFGIYEKSIDAVATINRKGYFFVNGWFYEIDELKKMNEQLTKKFALTDFFDADDHCYSDDKIALFNLKQRYSIWGPQTTLSTSTVEQQTTLVSLQTSNTQHGIGTTAVTKAGKSGTYAMIALLILIPTATCGEQVMLATGKGV